MDGGHQGLSSIIKDLQQQPANRACLVCSTPGPNYVCLTFNTFVCVNCAQAHRSLGHEIKSTFLADFEPSEVERLLIGGNQNAKEKFFARHTEQDPPFPIVGDEIAVKSFIEQAFVEKRWAKASKKNDSSKGKKKKKKQKHHKRRKSNVKWEMSDHEKMRYMQCFREIPKVEFEYVSGQEVKDFFQKSKLKQSTLAKIWALSDADCDSRLSLSEFCVAMHLCMRLRVDPKLRLPTSLPAELHPAFLDIHPSKSDFELSKDEFELDHDLALDHDHEIVFGRASEDPDQHNAIISLSALRNLAQISSDGSERADSKGVAELVDSVQIGEIADGLTGLRMDTDHTHDHDDKKTKQELELDLVQLTASFEKEEKSLLSAHEVTIHKLKQQIEHEEHQFELQKEQREEHQRVKIEYIQQKIQHLEESAASLHESPPHILKFESQLSEGGEIKKLATMNKRLENELEFEKDSKLCQICLENHRDTIILNCGHFLFCESCVKELEMCPTCREPIVQIQKVFD